MPSGRVIRGVRVTTCTASARLADGVAVEIGRCPCEGDRQPAGDQYPDSNRGQGATVVALSEVIVGNVRAHPARAAWRCRPAAGHRERQRSSLCSSGPKAGGARLRSSRARRLRVARGAAVRDRRPGARGARFHRRRGARLVGDAAAECARPGQISWPACRTCAISD